MILLTVLDHKEITDIANISAEICALAAPVFLMILVIRNIGTAFLTENDMALNMKSLSTGIALFIGILFYVELVKLFGNFLFSFCDEFNIHNVAERLNKNYNSLDKDTQFMSETLDKLLPMGINSLVNFFGKIIKPFMYAIQTISVCILYVTGPIALLFSILLDASIFRKWLNGFIVVIMWSLTMNLIETISTILYTSEMIATIKRFAANPTDMLWGGMGQITQLADEKTQISGIMIFVVQLMYLLVPFLTSKYMNISSISSFGSRVASVAGAAVMTAAKLGTGGAAAAGSIMKSTTSVSKAVNNSINKQKN